MDNTMSYKQNPSVFRRNLSCRGLTPLCELRWHLTRQSYPSLEKL